MGGMELWNLGLIVGVAWGPSLSIGQKSRNYSFEQVRKLLSALNVRVRNWRSTDTSENSEAGAVSTATNAFDEDLKSSFL